MAASDEITYKPVKRGDTSTFIFTFDPGTLPFDWSTVVIDCAMTSVINPADNSGAVAIRLNQVPVVTPVTNVATYTFTLTHAEAINLIPNQTYYIEPQLKQNGTYFDTPITGKVTIKQDYTI